MGPGDDSARVADLLAPGARLHLVGAGGVGMAGLAYLLAQRGARVTACDAAPGRLADWLRGQGIEVSRGHSPAHAAGELDGMIRTAAVPDSHPEIRAARERGLPVFLRGEVLPRLLDGFVSVAVGGTHGKTTTSTFIAGALKLGGRDPSWCIGGDSRLLGAVAGCGAAGAAGPRFMVVEADESDGTIALYRPDVTVLTNVEFDHMEHFADVAAFEACFLSVLRNTRRRVVYCRDDSRARALAAGAARTLSYGLAADADLRAVQVAGDAGGTTFGVLRHGSDWGRFRLPVPGAHNVLNALATLGAASELGLGADEMRAILPRLSLPARRLECVAEGRGIRVVSDYGHHPTEVAAVVRTLCEGAPRRLIAVFQPHRYTRTLALGRDFPAAFRGVSELVLTPVYAASEPPLAGGTSEDLHRHFGEQAGPGLPRVHRAESLPGAWDLVRGLWREGDLLLVIGAGDVDKVARWAADELARG